MVVNTLPSQVPVRKMEHEGTAKISSLLLDSSNSNLRAMRTYCCYRGGRSNKTTILFVQLFLLSFPNCRGWNCFA